MGQKVNPIGFRVAVNRNWRSRWFSGKKNFGSLLIEDGKIRDLIKKKLENAAVAEILIERYANRLRVTIYTARPGIVIGRKGQDFERIKDDIMKLIGSDDQNVKNSAANVKGIKTPSKDKAKKDKGNKEVYIDVKEVTNPDTNAQLVAENVALQIERRVSIKRAIKRAIKVAMDLGVDGVKVRTSGRLGGVEISRVEWYKEGKIPLHTLKANIEYGFAEAATPTGKIGVKVWICKKPEVEQRGKKGGI